jgi:methyl-accepting chemotaxis protein
MRPDHTLKSLDERLAFLQITAADRDAVRGCADLVRDTVADVIDGLYDHLQASGRVAHLLTDDATIERLKRAQIAYYDRMVSGDWDQEYYEHRLKIGFVHERVGLDPEYYLGAYAWIFARMFPPLVERFDGDPDGLVRALTALTRIVFFDMGMAIDAYIRKREDSAQEIVDDFTGTLSTYMASLRKSTGNIGSAISRQAEGAQRQSAAVAEITTAMSELSQTARQALSQAEGVMETTEHTIGIAGEGKKAVAEVSEGMDEIRQQMETLSERIQLLDEQTSQIGDIIASVSEISEQSKLLALNAAIEAARAGEHGRGFAVVATEIRNLADQSKQSTQQVRNILGDIQTATDAAVAATKQGAAAVERGAGLATAAGLRFNELADAVEESGDAAKLIATVSRQQGIGIEQIAEAMEEISANATKSAEGMGTIDEGKDQIDGLAGDMARMLEGFRKDDGDDTEKAA